MWQLGKREDAASDSDRWRIVAQLVAAALVVCVTGCVSGGRSANEPLVQSLHLFSVPVAVNLDNQPGPDGFSVRVYARGFKSSKSVLIPKGRLELLMFDGLLAEGQTALPPPLKSWQFAGSELKKHAGRSALGEGYRFTLRWDEMRPTRGRLTMVARYLPESGPAVVSAPSSIAMGSK